ncbi:pentapeptide repeat-containing protein [Saccharopolyspora hirsuta]|uniref:pentapeptide repeat-containing protein n=1 Tax=Saccharopolyspora hirsuta TaxID=1837 RepID=UPI00332A7E12
MTARTGSWGWAGELDGRPTDEVVEAVAAREPASAAALLTDELPPGGLLIVTAHRSRARPDEDLPAQLAEAGLTAEVVPLAGRELDEEQLAELQPEVLVLDAPDLAGFAGRRLDGVMLRNLLERLRARLPRTRLAIYVSDACFAVHHALPGTLRLTLPQQVDEDASTGPLADFAGKAVAAASTGDRAQVVEALGELARQPSFDPLSPPRPLVDTATENLVFFQEILGDLLRLHWPLAPHRWLTPDTSDSAPRTTAVLYRLLSAAEPVGPRNNLRHADVGRWLCALRAESYELLGSVTASLRGEDLSGANLSYAPSLEHCDLSGADLTDVDGYRVNVGDGVLDRAVLVRSCFARGHLKRTSLREADLSHADLEYASLQQADLTDAVLDGADLHRALVDQATGLRVPVRG